MTENIPSFDLPVNSGNRNLIFWVRVKGKFNKEETNGLTLCLPDLPVCFNLCLIYNNQL